MTDETKPEILKVSDPHSVPVAFANQVVGSGHLNSVVNITLAVARFSPKDDGTVDPDLIITSRLRMDLFCAHQLHEQLGSILQQNMPKSGEKPN